MKLALVTGAPGWLGTRLVESLLRGLPEVPGLEKPLAARVRCLVQPAADAAELQSFGAECVSGDLATGEGLAALFANAEGATVFHAAGVIHPTRGVRELFEVNTAGTQRLLALAAKLPVKRFVYVSSNSPIGVNPSAEHLFDEGAPYHPYMAYGRSKMLAEQAVKAAGPLETVIVRPPWFYGPRQPARQSLFFKMIRDGKMPLVGGGANRRSMAYVDNLCQGLLLCAKVEAAKGQIYWIADERPYPTTEIVDTVERLLETEFHQPCAHRRLRLPNLASQVAWAADEALQGVGLYAQKLHVLSEMNKTIACSIGKARRELGYQPRIALEEGMRRSLRWLFDRGGSL